MSLPKNVEDLVPLTPMQRLMLLHAIAAGGNGVLLNQVCYDIHGPLDADAFRRAWEAIVERHAALRTAFLWEGLPQPLQVVRTTVPLPWRVIDLTDETQDRWPGALEAMRREDLETPLPLGKAPLMRCTLARLGPTQHRFVWTIHHLVVDRWSHAVLFGELRSIYAALLGGEAPRLAEAAPFRDYVAWIARQDPATAEQFWREELAGVGEPTLLAGEGPPQGRGRRSMTRHALSDDSTSAIHAAASRWRTTPAAVLLAATALLVARRTGRDDVVLGVTVAGRPPELEEAGGVVGSFVNNLPARVTLRRSQSLGEWVRDVQRAQGRRQRFAHPSLADIQGWSEIPVRLPLFDTLVLLNLTDESDVSWPGIELVPATATLDAGYPLLLSVTMEREQLLLALVHDEAFAEAAAILAELDALLRQMVAGAEGARVRDLLPETAAPPPLPAASAGAPGVAAGARASNASGALADLLLALWREVLGSEAIGVDDDFLAVGGGSLQAAQLFAGIERLTGRALPLSTLIGAGSVRALLAELDRPLGPRGGALVTLRSAGTRPPLYVVPGIGGNVVGLSALARELGVDQPFGGFESPGLDGREAPLSSIEEIAERYAGELARSHRGPYHLLGICWGAAVAHEMARKLSQLGRPPDSLLLLDPAVLLRETSAPSPRVPISFVRGRLELYWDEFRDGDWGDRRRMLASKARRAAKVLAGGEALEQSRGELDRVKVREANTIAVTRFHPGRYEGRARIFITAGREIGPGEDPRLEWTTLITPPPVVVPVDGADSGDAISPAHVGSLAVALRDTMDDPA